MSLGGNQLERGCTAFCPLSYGKTSKSSDTTPEIFHQVDESEKIYSLHVLQIIWKQHTSGRKYRFVLQTHFTIQL